MSFDLPITEAVLNYLAPTNRRPVTYTYAPPEGVSQRTEKPEPRAVPIHDARKLVHEATLDAEGFALVPHRTGVIRFADDLEIRATYYREVEALLKDVTGAEKVVIFDHTLRSGSAQQCTLTGAREPVHSVHNDYTHRSGRRRVSDHLEPVEAEARLRGRHAVINVWRPIHGPVVSTPLAVCDARSIHPDDLVPTDLVYPDRIGEVYSVRFNPAHRWYFYSGMRRDEALLIKTYDSLEDGTARFSAHTAFDDPTAPRNAPARESIEVRALVFFR